MRTRMYGGVRGRKTKVGGKPTFVFLLLDFSPSRMDGEASVEFFEEGLDDAFGGSSVPAFGQVASLPSSFLQGVEGLSQGLRVVTHQTIASLCHRFGMLGIGVERDARDVQEGRFLRHVSRVGHDGFRVAHQIPEGEVRLRLQNVETIGLVGPFRQLLLGISVQRSYDGRIGVCHEHVHEGGQLALVIQQGASVEGEQEVFLVVKFEAGEVVRSGHPVEVMTEVVHQEVSHEVHVFLLSTCLVEVAVGGHARGEEDVRKSVRNHAVHLLGHVEVERAGACHEVSYLDALFAGYDGAGHGRGEVVHHHHQVGRVGIELLGEGHDDACQALEEVVALHLQASVGVGHVQVFEQRWLDAPVVS